MRAQFECLYCGYKWSGFHNPSWQEPKCDRCKDKQIKISEFQQGTADPFGYEDDKRRFKKAPTV